MESIGLEMNDLFDADNAIGEEFPEQTMINEQDENAEQHDEQGDGEEGELSTSVLNKLKNIKGASKKVTQRPQPKLDAARLTGERGIPLLPKIFKDVKFKGKGHEKEDLKKMMAILEHWGHRLFPKMPFDEVIERIERLGKKKEVQTCVNKIRLDMPLLDEDFVSADMDASDNEEVGEQNQDNITQDDEDIFDEIMRAEQERRNEMHLQSPSGGDNVTQPATITSTPASDGRPKISAGLTPEQLERIERNKKLAMEKRAARMGGKTPGKYQIMSPLTSTPAQSVKDKTQETSHTQENETAIVTAATDMATEEELLNALEDTETVAMETDEKDQNEAIRNTKSNESNSTDDVAADQNCYDNSTDDVAADQNCYDNSTDDVAADRNCYDNAVNVAADACSNDINNDDRSSVNNHAASQIVETTEMLDDHISYPHSTEEKQNDENKENLDKESCLGNQCSTQTQNLTDCTTNQRDATETNNENKEDI